MKENFGQALAAVLKHEGGYCDIPADPGGATCKGITLETYQNFKGNQYVTKADLKNIPDNHVETIYHRQYWDKIMGDRLPAGLDYAVFDFAVNSGPGRAVKVLQSLLGVNPDGAIGPMTLSKMAGMDVAALIQRYCAARQVFLIGLPAFATFGKGWTRRVEEVAENAPKMMG